MTFLIIKILDLDFFFQHRLKYNHIPDSQAVRGLIWPNCLIFNLIALNAMMHCSGRENRSVT